MLFEDLFNEDVKSVSVVTDITDGKQIDGYCYGEV